MFTVEVRGKTYPHRTELRQFRLRWNKPCNQWEGKLYSAETLNNLKAFCKSTGLTVRAAYVGKIGPSYVNHTAPNGGWRLKPKRR